jgi:hypothetical protein
MKIENESIPATISHLCHFLLASLIFLLVWPPHGGGELFRLFLTLYTTLKPRPSFFPHVEKRPIGGGELVLVK